MNIPQRYILSILASFATALAANATVVDLTGSNNSGSINGAQFIFADQQPTGTGVIQSFLRVQNSPVEEGYNTSGGTPFDDKAGPWTHDLTFGDLQGSTTTINGTDYFKLLLDVNEPGGNKSLISLDQLQFYTSPVGSQTTATVSSLGTLRYSFGANDAVLLDASRNHGSGSGDMYAYIPTSNFAGTNANDFVYLYSHFGNSAASEGGFEEWATFCNSTPVPEMSALFPMIGLLAAGLATCHVRRRNAQQLALRK
ncbi:MAG: hypothetical protein JO354_09890 [Verrucomicrobia bacterium]|nr:hypothetical protein [Verrucomicrobiota bacterium]